MHKKTLTKPVIAHIVRSMWKGYSGFMHNLITFLPYYNHKIICAFPKFKAPSNIQITGVTEIVYCPLPMTKDILIPSYRLQKWIANILQLTFSIRLIKLLKEIKVDLVHSHIWHRIDLQSIAILEKAKLPMIWTIHALPPSNKKELTKWKKAINLILYSNFGCIIAVSKAVAKRLVELEVCREEDIIVIYNGIDLKHFLPTSSKTGFLRSKLGIPQDAVLFGAVGRLNPEKGHDIFVEAAAFLLQKAKNVFFAIAGSGPMFDELREKIKYFGLERYFHLVGYLPDVRPFLNDLDVFVFPSRGEGFPLALLEALASGLPCIATQVGGIPEMLGENGGLMVPPESPEALAEAMYEMLLPERRNEYAMRSRTIAERFSIDVCVHKYAIIYEELLSSKRR